MLSNVFYGFLCILGLDCKSSDLQQILKYMISEDKSYI